MTQEQAERLAWDFAIESHLNVTSVDGSSYVSEDQRHDGRPGGKWWVSVKLKLDMELPEGVELMPHPCYCVIVEDQTGEARMLVYPGQEQP